MTPSKYVYLGIGSYVVCIESSSGAELWRTKLRSSELVSITVLADLIIAHANGHLFGVSKTNGKILWENGLKGLGYGHCFISAEGAVTTEQLHNFADQIEESSTDSNTLD